MKKRDSENERKRKREKDKEIARGREDVRKTKVR